MKASVNAWIPRGKLARGVAVVTSGTAGAQLFVALASPILTRLYTPEEFGVLAVYTGLLGIATVVSSFRYQLAIPLPRSDASAANVLILALVVLLVFVLAVFLMIGLSGDAIGAWTNTPSLVPYLFLLPCGIALAGGYQVFVYWSIRKGNFRSIARTKVQQGAGMVLTQVGLGAVGFGPIGLILGQIVGQAAGAAALARQAWKDNRRLLGRLNSKRVLQRARRYRDFPIYLSWAGLLNKIGSQMPLVLFAALFSPAVAGFYLLAYRITSRPAGLVGQAIRQVFFSGAATARRDGRLGVLTTRAFQGLLRIGTAPLVFLGVVAPELFGVVFGSQWREAGEYVQVMVPWLVASFIVSPLTTLNVVLERQKFGLVFQAVLLGGKLGGMLAGASIGGPLEAVLGYSIAAALVYLVFGLWIAAATGAPLKKLVGSILTEAAVVVPIAAILYISKEEMSSTGWTMLFVAVAVSVVFWRSIFELRRGGMRKVGTA